MSQEINYDNSGPVYGQHANAYLLLVRRGTKVIQRGSRFEPVGGTGEILYMPNLSDEINFKRTASYKTFPIVFSSEEILTYTYSSPLVFSLTWEYVTGVNIEDPRKMMEATSILHSMVLPDNSNGTVISNSKGMRASGSFPPGIVYVIIGKWINLRCVVLDVDIKYRGPWSGGLVKDPRLMKRVIRNSALLPSSAECTASFQTTQFYNTNLNTPTGATSNKPLSLQGAAQSLGSSGIMDREHVRRRGLSNITFFEMY